jgi:hypothetical protein
MESCGARQKPRLTITHRNENAGPRKPKFGQQSLATARTAPVGASSVICSARGVRLKFGSGTLRDCQRDRDNLVNLARRRSAQSDPPTNVIHRKDDLARTAGIGNNTTPHG